MSETGEAPIVALYQALLDRWNQRDAAGMADLIAEGGYMIGFDGSELIGRAEIESTLTQIFAQHPTAPYSSIVKSVRFLNDRAAALRATAGMIPPGKTDLDPSLNAVQTLVAQKNGEVWRVAVFQNTPAAFHGRPELVEKMTQELRAAVKAEKT